MPTSDYDPACLPDLLPLYYRRLFPFSQYYRWLSYGGVSKNYFQNREFSFTLKDDIYVRYQSFTTQNELEKEMQKMVPYKIDIGAVYSHRPSQHNAVKSGTFQALEKELVFDIDMTDYDDVRRCCSAADICSKCWTLMTIAIRILDRALREDFGFHHLLWVYSGRRGVHCWVCDDAARKLSVAARSAVAEYLSLIKGGEETVRKVVLSDPIHPFINHSLSVVERYFCQYAIVEQDILGSKESVDKVLALLPEDILSFPVNANYSIKKGGQYFDKEIMLQYCYPRLDVNVSKGVNHLLKSPFSIHPKTGEKEYYQSNLLYTLLFKRLGAVGCLFFFFSSSRISVPIDLKELNTFDPFEVPTISLICEELERPRADEAEDDDVKDKENEQEAGERRRIRDYKRTSLAKYVKVFDRFLEAMARSRKGEMLQKSDLQKDF
uniref:DNA primase n=1 Tax=Cyprinus carpio carpio TaxID=630221 RepID=A0A9J8C2Q8_CYPCA